MDKYIIMCGGEYKDFETPKHFTKIKGERIIDRTIRLLKENGAKIVTLGNRILRTETVALNMISVITYELEN